MSPGNHLEKEESTNDQLPPNRLGNTRQLLHHMSSATSGIIHRFSSRERPFYRRVWFWAGLSLGGGIIALSYFISTIDRTLPDKSELKTVIREQTLTIKAVDGSILQQQGEATREQLNLEKIPEQLQQAFIAIEDRRFPQHGGIDPQGIIRAAVSNLRSQNVVEGGSTITQQLARILFLKQERTIWRKLKEVRIAQKLEQELTKDQILERYLNLVYLGSGAYGVADAAWVYFSKPVDKLTLAEIATIAGLAPAPSSYSPANSPTSAGQRRNLVLQRMQEEGFITAAQRQAASQEPIKLTLSLPKRLQLEAPYFSSYILQELPKHVPADVLANGGLIVETTLNSNWQKAAEAAVNKTLKNQGRWQNFKQAALVAIDPRNGEIQAMVGGKDFGKNQFNRVTQAQRQPGSTFKSFVYATAIATGKSPNDTYLDAPFVVDDYEPKNYGKTFRGSMSMNDALTRSVNVVALKVLLDIGFEPTINTAHNMGIKSKLIPTYSLSLGSNEVNLLELTSAYGTFATQGLHAQPYGIRRILNRKGEVIWSVDSQPKRVLDPTTAAIMTSMLRNVVESGTGAAARLDKRPVAGKTGTSDEARDLWFIGYIPQIVAGVWLGNDDNRPTSGASGSAAYAWHEFMEVAVEGMPIEKFPDKPKLKGRKGSIKAKPIKPKKVLHGSLNSDEKSEEQDDTRSSRRRRSSNQETDNNSSRRRRRYRRSQESNSSANAATPPRRERTRTVESGSSRPRSSRESSSPASSSSPTPSWRERLRPRN
ncbi:transglycosylase domain-containing protein [Nostoc sp. UHCC 0870]|uniref:transglycosylase domain-containing protein n=1 Tax=Nostoc sp. UHCC 0870 TaxID=2914041 RepID=UPI001EDF6BCB|nr:penicillin-binding protein 1A [Nostoc sp. UHCC 0870]UKO99712.1 penicillin-binding protein 1A [Nostoc sp. UHCC 0870]